MSKNAEDNDVFKAAYKGFFAKKSVEKLSATDILDAGFSMVEESPGDNNPTV